MGTLANLLAKKANDIEILKTKTEAKYEKSIATFHEASLKFNFLNATQPNNKKNIDAYFFKHAKVYAQAQSKIYANFGKLKSLLAEYETLKSKIPTEKNDA